MSSVSFTKSSAVKATALLLCMVGCLLVVPQEATAATCGTGCNAGYFFSNCSSTCIVCPAGFSCAGTLDQPVPCAAGTFRATAGGSGACTACAAGTAATPGSVMCMPCPILQRPVGGLCTACAAGSVSTGTACTVCPSNYYASTVSGICEHCSPGHVCPSKTVDKETVCASGTYANDATATCVTCEAGYACPSTAAEYQVVNTDFSRFACRPGTYSASGASTCTDCPVMRYCPTSTGAPVACPNGYYATGGAVACSICPSGFYCDPASLTGYPLRCAAGQSSSPASTVCTTCPAGFQCPTVDIETPCVAGTYSNAGSTFCSQCPAGSYCPTSTGSPIPCPAGTYSVGGLVTACTACNTGSASGKIAYYAASTGNTACTLCPANNYCDATSATLCPQGTTSLYGSYTCTPCGTIFGSVAAYTSAAGQFCRVCPAGSSCVAANVAPVTCPSGSYSSAGSFSCTSCPAGYECPDPTILPQPCKLGYYSGAGNITCTACPENFACINRNQDPIACDTAEGYYSPVGDAACYYCPPGQTCGSAAGDTGGANTTVACPTGTYSVGLSCFGCTSGYFCPYPEMKPIPCPAGSYSLTNASMCTLCPAGFQCVNATAPIACSSGYYSRVGDRSCHACAAGYRCPTPAVDPIICVPGTYSEGLATTCTNCPAGYECPSITRFLGAAIMCPPGTFSVGNQVSCTRCAAGYRCPTNDVDSSVACPTGTYSFMTATSCTACPAGMMCPNVNGAIQPPTRCQSGTYSTGSATSCTACTAGNECPFTDQATINACPAGYFSGPRAASCVKCASGYYCPTTVVTDAMPSFGAAGFGRQIPCAAGYYSAPGQTSCTACPQSYYCTNAASSDGGRLRCPTGYFPGANGSFVSLAATECLKCPSGTQCDDPNVAPTYCGAGTYATEGQCYSCPMGFACPNISLPPQPCPAGTYSGSAATVCTPCAAGFLCVAQSTTATPSDRNCPIGAYCLSGAVVPTLCPAGTYGQHENGVSAADACVDCPSGYSCPEGTQGTTASNACPEGFYCPPGSPFPTPCPAGTYNNDQQSTTRSSCSLCPEGYFCPAGTARYAANPCPPGFFCPAGTGNGFDNGCPVGTYSPEYKATNGRQCYVCPSGNYCPIVGLTAAIPCPAGTYQPESGAYQCLPCEAGWACPIIGMTSSQTTPCSQGHFCPEGTSQSNKNPCPGGSFSRQTNLKDGAECFACWRGYACPAGALQPINCVQGYYCPGITPPSNGVEVTLGAFAGVTTSYVTQFPCPAGSYSSQANLFSSDQCSPCPAGEYCTGGGSTSSGLCGSGYYCPTASFKVDQSACKAGTYNPDTGKISQEDCLPCQPGFYCDAAAIAMTPCPAGTFTPYNLTNSSGPSGNEDSRMCLQCPAGYRCPIQSVNPTPCPVGRYSPAQSTVCTLCNVGHYCPHEGTSDDAMSRIFECPAGLYCPAGTDRIPSMQDYPCPVGHFCPRAIVTPTPCNPGTFNPNVGRPAASDCQACTKGMYCGASGLSNVSGECDPGHYCPLGSSSPQETPCPARYYRSLPRAESEDFCAVCPRGYYCLEGTTDPTPCTRGYYCVAGSEIPQPCPIGTFGNTTHLRSQDECSACTAGYYCDGLGLPYPTGLCDPGYYCISRAYTSAPPGLPTGGLCPKGGYCPPGSSFPTACAEGTFNNFTGGATQSDCTSCTPGYYCSGSNLPFPTGPCSAGYYCTGGASLSTQFRTPAGHYTPTGSSAPFECPLGTFNPSPIQEACESCIAGYYCPTRAMTTYLPCTVGGYCPKGSILPKACPRGTFQPETRMTNLSNCVFCSAGSYCASNNISAPTGICDINFYCKRGCVTSDCSFYSLNYGVVANTFAAGLTNLFGGICPWGHYCPAGSSSPTACNIGTVRDNVGAGVSTDCQPCPPGRFCPATGTSSNIPTNSPVPCTKGYYCPGPLASTGPLSLIGCADATCSNHPGESCTLDYVDCNVAEYNYNLRIAGARACARGFFCPEGAIMPTKCNLVGGLSTYQDQKGQDVCITCPRGRYCDPLDLASLQLPIACPAGRYCPFGTTSAQPTCPTGSWSDKLYLENSTQCKLCIPGRYCPYPGTSTTTTAAMPFCLGGYWCESGSNTGFGNVGVLGGRGGPCLPGYYCPNGTKSNASYACPPGTYSTAYYGSSVDVCIACPSGMYCAGSANVATTGKCANGYYCPLRCVDSHCARDTCLVDFGFTVTPFLPEWKGGACPVAHYCNGTATVGPIVPTICPDGTYQDEIAQSACKTCPAGYYCTNTSVTPIPCGIGKYCPAGTFASTIQFCPIGTYNFFPRATSITDCLLCPAGRYCPTVGMNNTNLLCDPGYYCTSGAATSTGTLGPRGGDAGSCPPGHYCLTGTIRNNTYPCPPGTLQPSTNAPSNVSCAACTPGFYCANWGNSKVTGTCTTGYYCPTRCSDATCSNQPCGSNCAHPTPYMVPAYASGGICPSGHFCAPSVVNGTLTGATAPVMCLPGTYAPDSGASSCLTCPAGRWCGSRETMPQLCPAGYYCGSGTTTANQNPCPTGTYAPNVNNSLSSDCVRCAGGFYCPSTGMSAVGPACSAGYYCTSGATNAIGTLGTAGGVTGPCPAGYYCPAGTASINQFPCPAGTYQPLTGRTSATACLTCTPGFYCPNQNAVAATLWCAAGYYCPANCTDAQCSNMACFATNSSSACLGWNAGGACPRGSICPQEATRGAPAPTACPAGSFTAAMGATVCSLCPAGYFCTPGAYDPVICPIGRYCPNGTDSNQPKCPPGTYTDITGGRSTSDCTLCPPGKFCAGTGGTGPTGNCAAGYYCKSGASAPNGTLGISGGDTGVCPSGYYCNIGTQDPHEFPCPTGTYNPATGATTSSQCLPCSAGYYCLTAGLSTVTDLCSVGYYCPTGCKDSHCATAFPFRGNCSQRYGGPCPVGFYCPSVQTGNLTVTLLNGATTAAASSVPLACPPGTYSPNVGAPNCSVCPAGYYCLTGREDQPNPIPCPAGGYCPTGTGSVIPQCPPGSYSDRIGLNASSDCLLCPPTRVCPVSGLTAPSEYCAEGYYCVDGAKNIYGGLGILGGSATPFPRDVNGSAVCPVGHYCPNASSVPSQCPPGTYNPGQGGYSLNTSCISCTGGSFCQTGGLSTPTGQCLGGYYCPGGCADSTCNSCPRCNPADQPRGLCTVSHYCPNGTTSPLPCPPGTSSNTTGAAICDSCPARFYCLPGQEPIICPVGMYCPTGTSSVIPGCPAGSFSNQTSRASASECMTCPATYACTTSALTAPNAFCDAGYYCASGAASVTATLGPNGGNSSICPPGHYCPARTSSPVPCPNGTMNPTSGGLSITACQPCTAGFYCGQQALSAPTGPCSAGFYCTGGDTNPTPVTGVCPTGRYCPANSVAPSLCPAGTFNALTQSTTVGDCVACPQSKYCIAGESNPGTADCDAGWYCTGGANQSQPTTNGGPCQVGYFCPSGSFQMTPCTGGSYCATPRLALPTAPCSAGYFCIANATVPNPTDGVTGGLCTIGAYCPASSPVPTNCSAGTFNPNNGSTSVAACGACTAGYYCPNPGMSAVTQICNAGYYCPAGQSTATPSAFACPRGHSCAAGTPDPTRCLAGQYQDLTGQSGCKVCPQGYYCRPNNLCPGTNFTMPTPCPTGFYCPAGTNFSSEYPCPAGTFSSASGLNAVTSCKPCASGQYCPNPGMTTSGPQCAAGYYCNNGSNTATPSNTSGMGSVCPLGHYCPLGASSPLQCPIGTFGPSEGLRSEAECTACLPGYYCNQTGASTVTGLCAQGYYCPGGESSSSPSNRLCPQGQICPAGSSKWTSCPSGTFVAGIGQSQCQTCPAGTYCDATMPCSTCSITPCVGNYTCPRRCPQGFYCPSGTTAASEFPCPAGRFGGQMSLMNVSACIICPPGQYCPFAGMSSIASLYCAPGYYCTSGSSVANPTDNVTGGVCPPGYYCPRGTSAPQACPLGTFQANSGATNITSCLACTAGKACTGNALTAPDAECSAGYYCPGSSTSPTSPNRLCTVGHYCPASSEVPIPCPNGQWAPIQGLTVCDPCQAGYYCNQSNVFPGTNISQPEPCLPGHYCPQGTTRGDQYPCPVGTFSNANGLSNASQCASCPPGRYCPTPGMTGNLPNCSAGFYCIGGATVANPGDGITGGQCPAGNYCPTGAASPVGCPLGTYSNVTGLLEINQCLNCSGGMYCAALSLTAPSGPCDPGFYCPSGFSIPNPSGYECTGGHYCPGGNTFPLDCVNGSYVPNNLIGRSSCFQCPRGYFCNLREQQLSPYNAPDSYVIPQACPRGYYCVDGTEYATQAPCPVGSFSNVTLLTASTDCWDCTPGSYCMLPGRTTVTGICEAGFYCARGSNSSRPNLPQVPTTKGGVCPSGRYCLAGSGEQLGKPCPPGTFYGGNGATNITFCQKCQPGSFCPTTGITVSTGAGLCSAGFYCPGGDSLAANPLYQCPVGHYCPTGTAQPIPCPGGSYQPVAGSATCSFCPEYYFCPLGAINPTICFPSHVCPAGSSYPYVCPNGTFAPATATSAMKSVNECAICPAGVYCTNGTITGPCAAGYLCEFGNSVPDPVSGSDSANKKKGGLCPIGHYCPQGSSFKRPCTNQTVGYKEGLQAATDCTPCRPGYYCIDTSVVPIDCPAGHYCPGFVGQGLGLIPCPTGAYNPKKFGTDLSWCVPCRQGFYCPVTGMVSPYTFPTPAGYYSAPGQAKPYPCPGGTYQPHSGYMASNTSACITCPSGYYCGPQSASWNQTCPEGTFCPSGATYPFHCPGGHYCPFKVDEPVVCPAGFYCPPLSTAPAACWNGTYCPAKTEIPLLCPDGYVSKNDTSSRASAAEACMACKPGTWSTNSVYCDPCTAGYVCIGATNTETPLNRTEDGGYICPIGNYCPTGSAVPTLCPAGTFNNETGGRTVNACTPCPAGFYQPQAGTSVCVRCGITSETTNNGTTCKCIGANRRFQAGDGSCRCVPGFIFYTDNQRISEEDSEISCTPRIYDRCPVGQVRSSLGKCVESDDARICSYCPNQAGRVDPLVGICTCDETQAPEAICNDTCVKESPKLAFDMAGNFIVHYDPVTGDRSNIDLDSSGILGTPKCAPGRSSCEVRMMRMSSEGSFAIFNPTVESISVATTAPQSSRRMLAQSTIVTSVEKTLANPIVCLNFGDAVLWDVSDPSREHYPSYQKDNLLNTNSEFDYTEFRELGEKIRAPNLNVKTFVFTFEEAGVYVFNDFSNHERLQIFRVVTVNEVCPENRYNPITSTNLVILGVKRTDSLQLAPDWILIGVLMGGLFLIIAGLIGGLWHFRRQTWGIVGTALPRYRSLGMSHLGSTKETSTGGSGGASTSGENFVLPPNSSGIVTLRLETLTRDFVPADFIRIISEEAGVDTKHVVLLSITEHNATVRFVLAGLDDSQAAANLLVNRIADTTNEIHGRLAILVCEEVGDASDDKHPANSMAALEDEYWDYEREVDLEGFNVRTLYDKLEDQTIHIVSQLTNQRDDLLLLCDKILVESEALKDMFVRIRVEVDENNRKEKEMIESRDAKISSGMIEFDLPEDLKYALTGWLSNFFAANMSTLLKSTTIHTIIEEEPIYITETVVHEEQADGTITTTRYNGPAPTAEEVAEINAVDELDDNIFKGGKGAFTGRRTRRAGEALSEELAVEMRQRLRQLQKEMPADAQDDSDIEETERDGRSAMRQDILQRRIKRLRRAMDYMAMPTALEEMSPMDGVATPEEIATYQKKRTQWLAACRKERATLDTIPADLQDDESLDEKTRRQRALERENILTKRAVQMQEVLRSLELPSNMRDDESLPAEEREKRAEKREKFLKQKLEKVHKSRFATMVPMELDDASDVDANDRAKRSDERDFVVAEMIKAQPAAPQLPDPSDPNVSDRHRSNRSLAMNLVTTRRADMAHTELAFMDEGAGISDHSDLDDKERKVRAKKRAELAAKRGITIGTAATELNQNSTHAAKNITAVVMEEFKVADTDRIPAEYEDDSDLEDDDRAERKVLRTAFTKGKKSKPADHSLPENEAEEGITKQEAARRHNVNIAFLRGKDARAANIAGYAASRAAKNIIEEAERLQEDQQNKQHFEAGRQVDKAGQMPAEFNGSDARALRLQAAFTAGKRAQTLATVPAELADSEALPAAERKVREMLTQMYLNGAQSNSTAVPEELLDQPQLDSAERANRERLRAAYLRGVHHQQGASTLKELPESELDDAARAKLAHAFQEGKRAANAGLAPSLPTELRDDIPMLSPEEVARRRVLQTMYVQGYEAQKASKEIKEQLADESIPKKERVELKRLYEEGKKAQLAQDALPQELMEEANMSDDEKKVIRQRKAAFLKGRQASRAINNMEEDLTADAQLSSKDRREIVKAISKGRDAQKVVDEIPDDLVDGMMLGSDERSRRTAARHAMNVGKVYRTAQAIPLDVPEAEMTKEEESAAFKALGDAANSSSPSSGGKATEEAVEATSGVKEQFLEKLRRDHQAAYKQLKERQKAERGSAMEELEEDIINNAKFAENMMADEFTRERKRLAERHQAELEAADSSKVDAIKKKHVKEMRDLQASQEAARARAQQSITELAEDRRTKLSTILEKKAENEVRLAKTLHNDQDNEIKKMKDESVLEQTLNDVTTAEGLKNHKDALMERLKLRERRQKAKMTKEKEFLGAQLKQQEQLENDALDSNMAAIKRQMQERARALHQGTPEELEDELSRIERVCGRELETQKTILNTKLAADRMSREKDLADRHAEEKAAELKNAQDEVDQLIQAKRRIEGSGDSKDEEKLSDNAKRAVEMLLEQKRLKEELSKKRRDETDKKDDSKIKEDALREIARREKERGQRMTDNERRAVLEEFRSNAAKMDSAMNDEQRRQQDETKKRLDERRRKKEAEANRKHVDEMTAELRRQEEEQRHKANEMAKRIHIKPTSSELPKEVLAAEEEMDQKIQRAKEALRRKQDEEQRKLEAHLEEEMKKHLEKETKRMKDEAQRKKLELMSSQNAKESMTMSEEARAALIKSNESDAKKLQDQLDNEAAVQRAKLMDQLEARKRKKKGELSDKQRADAVAEASKQEKEKDDFIRQAKINNEKKSIEEAMKRTQGSSKQVKAQDIAEVVMSERHREEVTAMLARQSARRLEEMNIREEKLNTEKDELHSRLDNRIKTEIDNIPADHPDREKKIEAIRNKAKMMISERIPELEAKHGDETQGIMDQLELAFAEEQLQLKMRQWNDIAQACGMQSPEQTLAKYQAKVAQRQGVEADDELVKFRKDREADNVRLQEQLAKDKADYETKMASEMARLKQEQEEELKKREAAMVEELKLERERKEKKLLAARKAAMDSGNTANMSKESEDDLKKRLLADYQNEVERVNSTMNQERDRQQNRLQDLLRQKKEKKKQSTASPQSPAAASPATDSAATPAAVSGSITDSVREAAKTSTVTVIPGSNTSSSTITNNYTINNSSSSAAAAPATKFNLAQGGNNNAIGQAYPAGGVAQGDYSMWIGGLVSQLHNSPIMEKLISIEKMLAGQVRHGLLSYYLDSKDRQISNEGRLEALDLSELTSSQFIVYCFAASVRENITRIGVELPQIKVMIAKSLPDAQTNASAFRNSYHYDHTRKVLHIRNSRLNNIGEFMLVTLHAMAHIKSALNAGRLTTHWNDADPAFLTEFYGLLEVCTEEMFYMRLPATLATRQTKEGRNYRSDEIMSAESLSAMEEQLKSVSKSNREAFLKTYFML